MLVKTVLIVFLATFSVSLAKDDAENELISTVLGTGTNLLKEFSKVVSDDADKYSLDFNSLYKKYEVASKAEQARNFLQSQFKKGAESFNENFKKSNIDGAEQIKKYAELVKKEDSILGEKFLKFADKSAELDRITEDITKYILDANRVGNYIDKIRSSLYPLEHKLTESIKKFETIVLEHIPKKGKK